MKSVGDNPADRVGVGIVAAASGKGGGKDDSVTATVLGRDTVWSRRDGCH